ncbi:hypothetical protein [Streptomyces sp. BBFR102]|uniref:hypothetical protein n=1 Tax=Streptomyces sp. BBFR102 TaxID=3448171 RepID=UPI003F52DF5B
MESVIAGALVDYRRCLIHLWFRLHESPPPEDPDEVRIRSYDLRTRARESLFRVQTLTADEGLGREGSRLLDVVSELHKAESRGELDEGRVRTREGMAGLVREAGRQLRGGSGRARHRAPRLRRSARQVIR